MNILMPMAGDGSRTKELYAGPKPVIPINELPMFYHAVSSAKQLTAHLIFVVREDHQISKAVSDLFPLSSIVTQIGKLNGAVLSCLLAEDQISSAPLLIMDCDMAVDFNYWDLFKVVADVGVVTFPSNSSAYSYVVSDLSKNILKIAEKEVISDRAVAGSFFWKSGAEFVRLAKQVISQNDGSEVYVSSVVKQAILEGLIVRQYDSKMAYDLSTKPGQESYINDLC